MVRPDLVQELRGALADCRAALVKGRLLNIVGVVQSTLVVLVRKVIAVVTGSQRYYLFAMNSDQSLEAAAAAAASHGFIFGTAEDLERFADVLPDFVMPNAPFLERGDRCLIQTSGDELVGVTWAAGAQVVHLIDGVHYNLPDHSFYSYLGYTLPKWRGCGFQPLRKLRLMQEYAAVGKRWMFGYVSDLSMAALRGTRRTADKLVGTMRFTRRGGRVRFTIDVDEAFWCSTRRPC